MRVHMHVSTNNYLTDPDLNIIIMIDKHKINPRDVQIGTKHEMEHTKDRKVAKKIALDHLKEHPLYYRVLPQAEETMSLLEDKNKKLVAKKKHKRNQRGGTMGIAPWNGLPPGFGGSGF